MTKKGPGRPPKYDAPLPVTGVRLRPELKAEVKEFCAVRGLTFTQAVEEALTTYLSLHPPQS